MENKLIVVSAIWCPSCLILKKHLKKLTEDYNISYTLLDYDLDEEEVLPLNVGDKLPVMIIGNKRLIGEKNYEEIKAFLKECSLI